MTDTPKNNVPSLDWLQVAKAAGAHGVRYRTNEALQAFLAESTERLSMFLDALDEWGCSGNDERAKEIMKFLSSGADLSNYEEKP